MITYNQFILESFDTSPARWRKPDDFLYEFTIDGNTYVVLIEDDGSTAKVDFGLDVGGKLVYDATNTGNQFKVFVTVIDCLKDYIETSEDEITTIKFAAAEYTGKGKRKKSARPELYARLAKKFMPKGFTLSSKSLYGYTNFVLTKKNVNEEVILESFDTKPAKWRRISESRYEFEISINTRDNLLYEILIYESIEKGIYHVQFELKNSGYNPHGITGTGNQFKVFITVINCIKDFIIQKEKSRQPVNGIIFSAAKYKKNPNTNTFEITARSSIYKKLIKKFLPSNYKLHSIENKTWKKVFLITKKNVNEEVILESFDTKPAKWYRPFSWEYTFSIDKNKYKVIMNGGGWGHLTVSFGVDTGNGVYVTRATNTGNQYKVFATVIDCIRDYITTNPSEIVTKISFTAAEEEFGKKTARASVYEKLVRKFIPKDFSFTIQKSFGDYLFILTKNNVNEELSVSDGIETWIRDFEKSDASQFKGKSKEKRRQMAIAAFKAAEKKK